MAFTRSGGQALAVGDKVYLFGGLCDRRRPVSQCEVYDTTADQYTSLTDLPGMVVNFGLAAVANKVYVVGGMDP